MAFVLEAKNRTSNKMTEGEEQAKGKFYSQAVAPK